MNAYKLRRLRNGERLLADAYQELAGVNPVVDLCTVERLADVLAEVRRRGKRAEREAS